MIVHQILPNFSYGDAIGDDTLALKRMLQSLGHESRIYAGVIHRKLMDEAEDWSGYRHVSSPDNVLIYHFSVGSEITEWIMGIPDKVVILFHNITPAWWFYGNSPHMTEVAAEGMRELVALRDRAVTAWADSEYNASILRAAGYPDVHVLPIIVDMSRLEMAPDPVFERQWRSSQYTWAFIGRVSPNKRHENIIRAYACYKKHIHPHSRLLLIGENRNCWRYTQAMVDRVRSVGVGDVHFTGMVDDAELVAAYRMADVFVCMSEHEGFCVPLLEAMHFDLPVLAYRAGAVPETMGGAGVLLNTRDPVVIAELVEQLRVDTGFRRSVIDGQRRRLAVFRAMDLTGCVRDLLEGMIR